ncbi:hypothetical protein AA0113_g9117 [Alternaria arborescens]|uniref:Uncharacterized protein n=1 Tax=Alternaria arborescens TaxID=156630 RepID=A0A4Q4RCK2_9PLEO|nr:hypothetical protein AA0111_g3504 [Alternaria arborescens]RYN34786.1 hypothetical protein AA0112_g5271 [Alternaria arborescens]RYO35116.1 hypothetical protein AA0111_g3504 [Alternaria arborescens]RYO54305.1 hypothetical protein AA0113_g9117 [Alternaria arborescens]
MLNAPNNFSNGGVQVWFSTKPHTYLQYIGYVDAGWAPEHATFGGDSDFLNSPYSFEPWKLEEVDDP